MVKKGIRHYVKAWVVAGVLVKKGNKYLLIQEKKREAFGKWNIPAGRLEIGDSFERRAIKEVFEETGYKVRLVKSLFVEHNRPDEDEPVVHAFFGRIVGGKLRFPQNEIIDAGWFSYQEVVAKRKLFRHPWVMRAVKMMEKKRT